MPVLFVGHGNPMITMSDNSYTRGWAELAKTLPQPKAILAISAHWYVPETRVTVIHPLPTIHDFYGFPPELFQVEYPVPGNPELAEHAADLLLPDRVDLDGAWGIDHGSWSVLRHMYPQARVPVIQLGINYNLEPGDHYRLGTKLRELRDNGVLILGSGNIVHNLAGFNWRKPGETPPAWATDFENWNRRVLTSGKAGELVDFQSTGTMAKMSVPTPDHYLPLIYAAAQADANDEVSFPVEGFDGGTMSMLAVLWTQRNAE
ncbi:MAG: 4,5-DOPA dioxygenase extradiol [Desulfuromonas sp.]|nr:MAG: 4,5-DOPA dioxygenase extradiol [Desulfuromonas sp.]